MIEGPSLYLATAGTAVALLLATLAGLWLGFRIAARDAALLASTSREAATALHGAQKAMDRCDALEQSWEMQASRVERLRASLAASATKAEQARARAAEQAAQPAAPEPSELPIAERRKLVARRLNGRSAA
jgi:hypothetical protein